MLTMESLRLQISTTDIILKLQYTYELGLVTIKEILIVNFRVVNIAIKVWLSLVSAILLEYRHQYCQYFLKQVSLAVSPIHFQPKSRYSSAILINGESATTHSVATCTKVTL